MAGRRRRRQQRRPEEKPEFIPKTEIGKKVKAKEILTLEEIFEKGKPILEAGIVDEIIPDLYQETLEIRSTQRVTDCGRKPSFRIVVIVGDKNGHVGVGMGKSEEIRPAVESAARDAKLNIMSVPMGCGSWECGCKKPHSVPIKVVGGYGSVEVTLKPAPRGLGLAANKVVKKVLNYAGVKDVWSFSRGSTSNIYNMAMATIKALDSLNSMRYTGNWAQSEEPKQEKKKEKPAKNEEEQKKEPEKEQDKKEQAPKEEKKEKVNEEEEETAKKEEKNGDKEPKEVKEEEPLKKEGKKQEKKEEEEAPAEKNVKKEAAGEEESKEEPGDVEEEEN